MKNNPPLKNVYKKDRVKEESAKTCRTCGLFAGDSHWHPSCKSALVSKRIQADSVACEHYILDTEYFKLNIEREPEYSVQRANTMYFPPKTIQG
jgi:hypothetical protein